MVDGKWRYGQRTGLSAASAAFSLFRLFAAVDASRVAIYAFRVYSFMIMFCLTPTNKQNNQQNKRCNIFAWTRFAAGDQGRSEQLSFEYYKLQVFLSLFCCFSIF